MTYTVLDFRVSDVGGPIGPGTFYAANGARLGWMAERALGAPNGHVLFLLHGFNNSRREGLAGLSRFAELLEAGGLRCADAVVVVLWPGDSPWGGLSYSGEEADADGTARKLAETILGRMPRVDRASFAAHSLGSRVTMTTAGLLRGSRVALGEVVLMAAAVDRDALARPDRFRAAAEACERVSNLSSGKDKTLKWLFPLGDGLAALLFGGYTQRPLGLVGPTAGGGQPVPRNVLAHPIPDGRKVDHGDYLPNASAAQFAADAVGGLGAPRYP